MIGAVIRGEEEAKKWYNCLMNMKEDAEYLGVSRYMFRKVVKEDKIPYSKSFNNVTFHKTILDAWKKGEFIPGRIKLVLDKESIDLDQREAIKEHYERYPHLKEKVTFEPQKTTDNSDYKYKMTHDGVQLTLGNIETGFVIQAFFTHSAIEEIYRDVQIFK